MARNPISLTAPHIFLQNGFVNSLAFAKSGKFLLVGHGQVYLIYTKYVQINMNYSYCKTKPDFLLCMMY